MMASSCTRGCLNTCTRPIAHVVVASSSSRKRRDRAPPRPQRRAVADTASDRFSAPPQLRAMRIVRVPTSDSVVLEVQDHGVSASSPGGPGVERETPLTMLLAHANGFHGRVFDPAVRALRDAGRPVRVITFDARAHGASTPPSATDPSRRAAALRWETFADDLVAVARAMRVDGRCVAVGHSLGAHAALRAEAEHPGTFTSIYAFEPIFVVPESKLPPRVRKTPLAESARRRRRRFQSKRDAARAFGSKPPLSALHPDALRAYVEHGFVHDPKTHDGDGDERGEGVRLAMSPEDEAAVFDAGADETDALDRLRGGIRCPVTVVRGSTRDPMDPRFVSYAAAVAPIVAEAVGPLATTEDAPGMNHFGPVQDPAAFAKSVWRHVDRCAVFEGCEERGGRERVRLRSRL